MTEPNRRRGQGIRNTLSSPDKRRVYRALENVTEEVSEGVIRYKPDAGNGEQPWTDASLAENLGLAEHHVRYVRKASFGELYEPKPEPAPEPDLARCLGDLEANLRCTDQALGEAQRTIATHAKGIGELVDRLNAVESALQAQAIAIETLKAQQSAWDARIERLEQAVPRADLFSPFIVGKTQ